MSYQTITGSLSPCGHPGSYNGQDAYNDLLITGDANENDFVHRWAKLLRPWTQAILRATAHETERSEKS